MPPLLPFLQTALEAANPPAAGPDPSAGQGTSAPPAPFTPHRLFILLALLFLTAAGAALRFHEIARNGFWLDEAFSVWMAAHPLPELFGWLIAIDQHPPLYYTLLHSWLWGGDEDAYVRSLSALLSTGAIPVLFLIGRQLGGAGAGLIAAALLAFSPFHVRFAQEARMYALLTLCASLAILALVHLLTMRSKAGGAEDRDRGEVDSKIQDRDQGPAVGRKTLPGAPLAWGGYVVFTVATLLTHNTAVFLPLAANLFVIGFWLHQRWDTAQDGDATRAYGHKVRRLKPRRRGDRSSAGPCAPTTRRLYDLRPPPLRQWLLAQGAVLLLWLPWAYAFVVQSAGVYNEFWIPAPTAETVLNAAKALLADFLPRTLAWGITADPVVWLGYAGLLLLCVIALRKRPATLALLLCLLLTPWAGELLVSLRRPIFYDRTLIWTTIPLILLLAFGLLQLRWKPLVAAALLLLLSVNLLSLQNYYRTFEKEQWREAAAFMAGEVQEGDLILFNATWVQIPFDHYFQRFYQPQAQAGAQAGAQPQAQPGAQSEAQTEEQAESQLPAPPGLPPVVQHGVPVDLFDAGVLEPKMTPADLPRLEDLLEGRDRVWLVYSHDWYTDPQRLIPAALKQELHYLGTHPFNGLQILEFER